MIRKLVCVLLASLLLAGALSACAGGGAENGEATSPAAEASAPPEAVDEAPEWPEVNTEYGRVRGASEEGVTSFLGVPFAAPPVDELRFAPPRAPENWEGVLDCIEYGDAPVQTGVTEMAQSEDCLYLNIWAPEDAKGKSLPVYVFIHGGAYASGTAGNAMYDGTRFAQDGVVQVNVAYRLNAMGFLPAAETEEQYGTLGNVGTLDQIFALEWVQANIAAFGGNPQNVTIGGESAGAFSVSNMILSPLAKGLFQRAILESGNSLGQRLIVPEINGDRTQAIARADAFAASLGAAEDGKASLAKLREFSAEELAEASAFEFDLTEPSPYYMFNIFDGKVIPENPYQATLAGSINDVDILAGYNTDEGSLFIPEEITAAQYEDLVRRTFGDDAPLVLERFPVDETHTPADRARYIVLMGLRMGNDIFADELSRRGQNVYFYHFNYDIPALDALGLGTMHALELPFVFDTLPDAAAVDEEMEAFKEEVHTRWLNFIVNGDPNQGAAAGVEWPRYTPEGKEILVLSESSAAGTAQNGEDIAFLCGLLW